MRHQKGMHTWWTNIADTLRGSLWPLPTLCALLGISVAIGMVLLDEYLQIKAGGWFSWLFTGNPETVRDLVSTVLSSVVTIVSVVFSITIVALQLASSQFGPRMLRHFRRDRGTQWTLATFLATFSYCLVVLTMIGRLGQEQLVLHMSSMGALALAMLSLGVLIYFVHHIAQRMQAEEVVAAAADDLNRTIKSLYPDPIDSQGDTRHEPRTATSQDVGTSAPVRALQDAYVQNLDYASLADLAEERHLEIQVLVGPGDFAMRDAVLLRVWPGEALDEGIEYELREAFIFGVRRTPTQDVQFAVSQVVEIAVRSLSPSINDPFTASDCIDRLGAALLQLAGRRIETPLDRTRPRSERVIVEPTTYADMVNGAFDQIRHHGREYPMVMIRLLKVIDRIAEFLRTPEQREALRGQAEAVYRTGKREMVDERDLRNLTTAFQKAMTALEEPRDATA